MIVSGLVFKVFNLRFQINKSVNRLITPITLFILLSSCGTDIQTKQFAEKQSQLSNTLVEANKSYVKEESNDIDAFIKKKGFIMQKTETGLRYKIDSINSGEKIIRGDLVKMKYQIFLLNGTLCYSSDSSGLMSFKVEQEDVPNGFHQAVQLMHKGEKAQLVMPAHLAYGLSGDQNKIPTESALYCTIHVVDVKKNSK